MPRKQNPRPISVYFNGSSFKPIEKSYSDALGNLLAKHFCEVTGLSLNSKRWFMFNVWNEVRSAGEGIFEVEGEIIGPDSVAYDARAIWQEREGMPVAGGFSKLPVPALIKYYGDAPSKEVALGDLPFKVEWIQWWESVLPDFFMEVQMTSAVTKNMVGRLQKTVEATEPAYHKMVKRSRSVKIKIDFGSSSPVTKNIQSLFSELAKIHTDLKIKKVVVGIAAG